MAQELYGDLQSNLEYLEVQKDLVGEAAFEKMVQERQATNTYNIECASWLACHQMRICSFYILLFV